MNPSLLSESLESIQCLGKHRVGNVLKSVYPMLLFSENIQEKYKNTTTTHKGGNFKESF